MRGLRRRLRGGAATLLLAAGMALAAWVAVRSGAVFAPGSGERGAAASVGLDAHSGHEPSPAGQTLRPEGAAPGQAAEPELRVHAPPRRRTVGPGAEHSSLAAALAAASPGDTVAVAPGTYRERLVVRIPLVLLGEGRPVIDGGGEGHVIEALAPLELRGFELRGSGKRVETEDAGLMVRGATARVEDNLFTDVFYGVYLKDAPGSLIRGNRIEGKPLEPTRRGDGIRLWYANGTRIERNEVVGTRDVVVYFTDSLVVTDNRIADGRYGLHYMYSHHNRLERNRFVGNHVGAFIMYSTDIELRDNVFAEARGPVGVGLGLKDSERVRAEGNLFVRNAAGIYLDNSPRTAGVRNLFTGNLLFGNGAAIRLLPSVAGNVFETNDVVENDRPVEVLGGGGGEGFQNRWFGNHWTEYAGFDADGDGFGDAPFVHARLADALLSRHPQLRLFALSPAVEALEVLSRFFPLLRPQPIAVDSAPRLAAPALARWRGAPPVPSPESEAAARARLSAAGVAR